MNLLMNLKIKENLKVSLGFFVICKKLNIRKDKRYKSVQQKNTSEKDI